MTPDRTGHGKPAAPSDRNDDIEILRGVSVLFVLYEHFALLNYGAAVQTIRLAFTGWTGVDLFFCISGYVIYRSLSATLGHGDSPAAAWRQIAAFWVRRVWRLAPTAWLWLLIGLPTALTFAQIGSPEQNLLSAAAAALNIANLRQYACNAGHTACGTIFMHYWSLSLEVQFYLVLPFAMWRLPRNWLAAALGVLIAAQFALVRPTFADSLAWFLRTDAIAWGILIAMAAQRGWFPRFLSRPALAAPWTLILLLLLGSSHLFRHTAVFTGLAALFSAGLVWAASANAGYIWRPAWATDVLRWIGLRSYSLYVCHLIVFRIVRQTLFAAGLPDSSHAGLLIQIALAYALTVLAAHLSYRYVERPFRRRGREAAARYLSRTEAALLPAPRSAA